MHNHIYLIERWKVIKNYEGLYEISDSGNIYSYHRDKLLKLSKEGAGYLVANLCKNGKAKTYHVHRLVLEAFIGPCPNDKEANHKDGVKK